MTETKTYKERRIWYFACDRCGKGRRQSHKKQNAANHLCWKCRREQANENQVGLFDNQVTQETI